MNYNLILTRLLNTVKQRPNMPHICFGIFTKKDFVLGSCNCIDYCKHSPPPELIVNLCQIRQNKNIKLENF